MVKGISEVFNTNKAFFNYKKPECLQNTQLYIYSKMYSYARVFPTDYIHL